MVSFYHPCKFVALVTVLLGTAGAAVAQEVDLELVLAVDASGSVDPGEFELQLEGIAAGFRDPAVRAAIRSGRRGRIAVNLLTWAEPQAPKDETGWFVLDGDAGAEAFARLVSGLPRRQNGATGLGAGVAAAVRSIEGNAIAGLRRAIDVSGDGRETAARDYTVQVPQARAMAQAFGIVINGLAIENEEPGLQSYYRERLQSGPGSFVMAVKGYADFAEAMRRKLLREIDYRPPVAAR